MDGLDPSSIDQSTQLGQITMLIAVIGIIVSAVSPLLPKRGEKQHKSRLEIMQERLELETKNATIVREVNRNLTEWQLVARTLVRVLKNEIVDLGGEDTEQVAQLTERLIEIDSREVDYGGDEPI